VPHIRNVIVLFGALLPGYAWAAGPAPSGFDSCAQITDDKERLACFDREFALQKDRKQTGAPAPASPPAPQLSPEQAMGLTPGKILQLQRSPSGTDFKELTARIQGVSSNASGHAVFMLDNGQVWQQVEADSKFAVRPGDSVRISKAVLGSFFMSVSANAHMNTRVSRAQ